MQKTIAHSVSFSGIGLHSGKHVDIKLLPYEANGGIIFRRMDLNPVVDIPAQALLISDTTLCSCLTIEHTNQRKVSIKTVEHLMAALALLGVDNLIVETYADELPIMDGSALPFVEGIMQTGLQSQLLEKKYIKVLKPIHIELDDKKASLLPDDGFKVNFEINFEHQFIKNTSQVLTIDLSAETYLQICKARTFGFLKDIEYLRKNNLVLGGNLDNAIVLDTKTMVNKTDLRMKDEFVRHKVLDAFGDLYLAGHQIIANFQAYKSGHHLNNLLVRELLSNSDNYCYVTESQTIPILYPQL